MSKLQVFLLGSLGAVLPILVSLLTIDIGALINDAGRLTVGHFAGYGIRLFVLVLLGGLVALLNGEVRSPLALVQLGISAPALITGYINAGPLPSSQTGPQAALSLGIGLAVSSRAEASTGSPPRPGWQTAGVIDDVLKGFGSRLDTLAPRGKDSTGGVPGAGAQLGDHCQTPSGRFGPRPPEKLGAPCSVSTPSGTVTGVVSK